MTPARLRDATASGDRGDAFNDDAAPLTRDNGMDNEDEAENSSAADTQEDWINVISKYTKKAKKLTGDGVADSLVPEIEKNQEY